LGVKIDKFEIELVLIITVGKHSKLDLVCDNSCHWKSHESSLAHLPEVEFKELIGTHCEFQFIRS
jgi:hypothetical protein